MRPEKLASALASAARLNKVQLQALGDGEQGRRSHISARTHKGIELIPLHEVRYFQADQKYVTVNFGEGEVIIDETLRELEEEFDDQFVRVHRNALIAKRHIAGLERDEEGQMRVRLDGVDDHLAVSRRHLPGVRKVIKQL